VVITLIKISPASVMATIPSSQDWRGFTFFPQFVVGSLQVMTCQQCYAPINVMPHYHRYGMRWGKVRICTHQLGKYWRYKPPLTPTCLPVAKPGDSGDLHDRPYIRELVFLVISASGLYIELQYSRNIKAGTRSCISAQVSFNVTNPSTSGNCSDQFPH